jgi:signal transduction histidine kinase
VRRRDSFASWLLALALLVLLVVLGTLQHRWLSQIGDVEREQMRTQLRSAAERFAADFDRELTRVAMRLAAREPAAQTPAAAAEYARWRSSALFPDLVHEVFVARPGQAGEFRLSRLETDTGRLAPSEWPAELSDLRARLERIRAVLAERQRPPRRDSSLVLAADVPALVLPLPPFLLPPPVLPLPVRPPGLEQPHHPPPFLEHGCVLVWLSRQTIQERLLPELAARHFGGPQGIEYDVEIASLDEPARVIFRAGPSPAPGTSARAGAVAELFTLRPPEDARASAAPGPPALPRTRPQWRLAAAVPYSALEASVTRAQHWNLAVGFGVLLLLALTMAMLIVTTLRARRLARQQLQFVANVTHELATPLTAVRTAGQNLADGVVNDPGQVRKYGALIDRDASRLGETVRQVLTFAGMVSGRTTLTREAVSMEKVIADAVAECRLALEEKGVRLETDASGLPDVSGDAPMLRRALVNLIGNAIKYGDGWIGVRACTVPGAPGPHLEVTVEDRGPGIAAADVPHIFEPFYRGRSSGSVSGSGLGLTLVKSIVEAHGGRVTVATRERRGTAVTLHLPNAR